MKDGSRAIEEGSGSVKVIGDLTDQLGATYSTSRGLFKPELYSYLRALSVAIADDSDEVYETEIRALEALGAVCDIPRPACLSYKPSSIAKLFKTDPLLSLQDAIISCLKIAEDCSRAGNSSLSK